MRARGNAFEAPAWWLEDARALVRALSSREQEELGRRLARIEGRKTPYSRTVLSKFAREREPVPPTQELALALSVAFDIQRPFYVPRNRLEAAAIEAIARVHDVPDSARRSVEAKYREKLEELEDEAERQGGVLESDDEVGRSGSRGPRRVHRRG